MARDLDHILEHTQTIWPQFKKANIFITGATGFVGTWLVQSFLHANRELGLGARLVVLSRNPQNLANLSDLEILPGDLQSFEFPNHSLDYIIHAAYDHRSTNGAVNLDGVQRVIDLAQRHGVRQLLFTSSGAVYGEQPPEMTHIPEEFCADMKQGNLYAETKRQSEALFAEAASRGLSVLTARLFAFSGPHLPLNLNFAIGNFIRDALSGAPIRIEGDGTPLRSYLYAADLAIWLWTILSAENHSSVYNIGSDQAVSILDLASIIERICGTTRGISIAKEQVPGQLPNRYVPSIDRARVEHGLQPWIAVEEGIERMYSWYRARYASMK